jgi:RNA polymerase sigma factor (TIGR02999 family)
VSNKQRPGRERVKAIDIPRILFRVRYLSDVTHILDRVHQGDPKAAEELLPLVYEELRKLAAHRMAGEAAGHTLQATALVHEAWLRLVRTPDQAWQNRAHFFRTAAECMRRILIDNARRKLQIRHGGGSERVPLDDVDLASEHDPRQLLYVHETLDRLAAEDVTKAEIVKLRFFVGMENREIAELLDISERTVERGWTFAKAWLLVEFSDCPKGP